jgi:hypothetical protein
LPYSFVWFILFYFHLLSPLPSLHCPLPNLSAPLRRFHRATRHKHCSGAIWIKIIPMHCTCHCSIVSLSSCPCHGVETQGKPLYFFDSDIDMAEGAVLRLLWMWLITP